MSSGERFYNVWCRAPTLIVASAADRLLPSLEESARLVGKIPDARRVVLPNSGHTALLESGISLAEIMGRTGFLPEVSSLFILIAITSQSASMHVGGTHLYRERLHPVFHVAACACPLL